MSVLYFLLFRYVVMVYLTASLIHIAVKVEFDFSDGLSLPLRNPIQSFTQFMFVMSFCFSSLAASNSVPLIKCPQENWLTTRPLLPESVYFSC